MSDQPPTSDNIYGRLTGWKRLAIVVLGAISGAAVALLFSVFSGHPTPTWELIIGALGGALLGLSASLGESAAQEASTRSASCSSTRRVILAAFCCACWEHFTPDKRLVDALPSWLMIGR